MFCLSANTWYSGHLHLLHGGAMGNDIPHRVILWPFGMQTLPPRHCVGGTSTWNMRMGTCHHGSPTWMMGILNYSDLPLFLWNVWNYFLWVYYDHRLGRTTVPHHLTTEGWWFPVGRMASVSIILVWANSSIKMANANGSWMFIIFNACQHFTTPNYGQNLLCTSPVFLYR